MATRKEEPLEEQKGEDLLKAMLDDSAKVMEKRAMLLGEIRAFLGLAIFLSLEWLFRAIGDRFDFLFFSFSETISPSKRVGAIIALISLALIEYIRRKRTKFE